MIKIHQELSVLTAEKIADEAIEQCAIEDGLQLIERITSRCKSSKTELFVIKCVILLLLFCNRGKLLTNNNANTSIPNSTNVHELLSDFIIPEANRIVHRNENGISRMEISASEQSSGSQHSC